MGKKVFLLKSKTEEKYAYIKGKKAPKKIFLMAS